MLQIVAVEVVAGHECADCAAEEKFGEGSYGRDKKRRGVNKQGGHARSEPTRLNLKGISVLMTRYDTKPLQRTLLLPTHTKILPKQALIQNYRVNMF